MFDPSSLLDSPTTPMTTTRLFESVRVAEQQAITQRQQGQNEALGQTLYRLARLKLTLGDSQNLVESFQESEMLIGSSSELHVLLGCALCYAGYFNRGKNRLEQAYKRNPTSEMLRSQFYAAMGLVYHLDRGDTDGALGQLNYALETIQGVQFNIHAAVLNGQAQVAILQGRLDAADGWLKKADDLMNVRKILWHRPAWYVAAARLALARNEPVAALTLARKGLNAINERGDLHPLPALYRISAAALETMPDRLDDARDAYQRAVAVARVRGSRVELARCLYEIGTHFQHYYRRTTQRARGAGFLFEAEQIYREVGIAAPGAAASANP